MAESLDIREKGRANGEAIFSDRRLFMQFFSYGEAIDTAALAESLDEAGL
ncbi:MAG: hypothetical protein HY328_10465, partial [Chloroflexi bacterium]|nr:hypothetical protein [Chloroflexota bacterium]